MSAKLWNYVDRCKAEGLAYIPLAINTFGWWHPMALQVIACLDLQLTRAMDGELGMVKRHLRQRLAVVFIHDNIAMLGVHVPSFAPPGAGQGRRLRLGPPTQLLLCSSP